MVRHALYRLEGCKYVDLCPGNEASDGRRGKNTMIGRFVIGTILKSAILALTIASLVVAPVSAQVQEAQAQQGQNPVPPHAAVQNQAQPPAPTAGQSATQP